MKEIWQQALLSYNLPLTVLLGLVFLFWIISLLGMADFEFLEADLELDADGSDVHGVDGVFGFILRMVNAYDVPVMLVLSLLTLFMWTVSIASNYYLNPNHGGWIALGLFLVNFIFSVLLVKVTTQPLRPLFRAIKNDEEHQEPLIGSTGSVKSKTLDGDFGQCEIVRPKGAPALLNCRLAEGEPPLVRGDEILVIGYEDTTRKFIIKSLKTENS